MSGGGEAKGRCRPYWRSFRWSAPLRRSTPPHRGRRSRPPAPVRYGQAPRSALKPPRFFNPAAGRCSPSGCAEKLRLRQTKGKCLRACREPCDVRKAWPQQRHRRGQAPLTAAGISQWPMVFERFGGQMSTAKGCGNGHATDLASAAGRPGAKLQRRSGKAATGSQQPLWAPPVVFPGRFGTFGAKQIRQYFK